VLIYFTDSDVFSYETTISIPKGTCFVTPNYVAEKEVPFPKEKKITLCYE